MRVSERFLYQCCRCRRVDRAICIYQEEEMKMNGWMNRILRVNLSDRKVTTEELGEDTLQKWIGGRGLNLKILYEETEAGIDPLGPENKMIFGAGLKTVFPGRTN